MSEKLEEIAQEELKKELEREEIEKIKARLRYKKTLWEKIFPFKIIITRR